MEYTLSKLILSEITIFMSISFFPTINKRMLITNFRKKNTIEKKTDRFKIFVIDILKYLKVDF